MITVGLAIAVAICAARLPPADVGRGGAAASTSASLSAGRRAPQAAATRKSARKPNAGGGTHVRIATRRGPIHLFRPAGYDRRTAGIVVYVHGHHTRVDRAWREHELRAQFTASRRNALFIAPEAPSAPNERASWTDLRRLITTTLQRARVREPPGPLVVVGHSGAYRTIVPWLEHPRLGHLILLDALYGNERDFAAWLAEAPAHQMTLVVRGTSKWADPFVRGLNYAVTMPEIPASLDQLSQDEREAKLLSLRSQYGHFEIVTEGKVIPLLLGRTLLAAVRRPAPRPTRRAAAR